ncbi:PREDICTED: putative nuclease HARBI1, partial [Prunus dulcis]
NCLTAWQGDYGNRKGQKIIILETVAGFDTWVWHAFFGVAGSQNDLNMLGQSRVFNDVLRGEGLNITYQINNTVYHTG